jgi:polysaccharide deacetylase family protein (PEP-CTERM system associated)
MEHRLVWKGSREDFRQDVDTGVKMLEDITGQKVDAFRAPGFSIRETEGWAFEILHELGIRFDASVFPAAHAHGGMPSFPVMEPALIQYNGITMKEFPVSFKTVAGKHIVFNGGGYFRLFPYALIRAWSLRQPYLLSYIHPRDLDAGQPMVPDLPLKRKFRSYVGLKTAESKLRRYLTDFSFTDIRQADAQVDWSKARVFSL